MEQIISVMTDAGLDTDSLKGIPKRYVQALSKVHSAFDFLSIFLNVDNDPQKIIGKIDDVLTQEKKSVSLILEDLDRNEGADFQLDNILATLRRLRETKNISFILTGFYQSIEKNKQDDISENRMKDFAKVCGYVEDISDMAYDVKFDMLSKIAEYHVKKKYPDDITISRERQGESLTKTNEIDHPVLTDETKLLLTPQTSGNELYDYTNTYPSVALCSLINTPRMIKMIIRDVDAAWDKLHGEVDYQHLLAMSILRNTDSPLLYFMQEKQPDYDKTEEFNKLVDQFVNLVTNQDSPIMREKHKKLYTRILAWCFRCGIVFDFDKIGN